MHQPNNIFAGTQVVSFVEVRGANRAHFDTALGRAALPGRRAARCLIRKAVVANRQVCPANLGALS
jgi:hypothetical protein